MKRMMMQRLIIPFIGLKDGAHQFDFDVDSAFFEQFEHSIIEKAEMHIDIDFVKKPTLFNLTFMIKGTVHTICDRCSDALDLQLKGEEELVVKFDNQSYDETDEIKIIPHGEYELDLSKEVYDFIHLLLPNKIVHKKTSDCNQEVIAKLEELSTKQETQETDPRWSELSKLKDKSE